MSGIDGDGEMARNMETAKIAQDTAKLARKWAKHVRRVMKDAPTLLVWGFKHHGKSSFIDSVTRCMNKDNENLLRRAGSRAPDMYSVLHVYEESHEDEDEDEDNHLLNDVLFRLVDSPAVASEDESKTELARVLKQGVWHKMRKGEKETDAKSKLHPECVILVVSSMGCNMAELRALADTIHGTGTPFVVAVTHKHGTTKMHLGSYLMQVAEACRNESVFCFENYVQRPDDSELGDVEHNYEANRVMSNLLIQALEYIWEDRLNDKFYSNVTKKGECSKEEKDMDDKKGGSHKSCSDADESFEVL